MAELPSPHDHDPVLSELIYRALDLIESKYGPDGIRPLAYHNADHTRNVIASASELADKAIEKGLLQLADKRLLLIAAAYHDVEQDKGSGENEYASAEMAAEEMRIAGEFSEDDIRAMHEMIMGTQVRSDENGAMSQSAASDNYFAQLLADADLSSLGKPTEDYWRDALSLFVELYPQAFIGDEMYLRFVASQPGFLARYTFYTQEANELFPYKADNSAYVEESLSNK